MLNLAYYLKHTIKQGENLQIIANKLLGDITKWIDIATLNDLQYPYIVATNQEKLTNLNHLVTYGDQINLPNQLNQVSDLNYDTFNPVEAKDIYDSTMGMDIGLEIPYGEDTEDILSMYAQPDGHDIGTVTGIQNLKDSIRRRLLTEYGSLLYHPNYGTHLTQMIGEKINSVLEADLKVEILRTIDTDPRVADAQIVDWESAGNNGFICVVSILPHDEETQFEMFIEHANEGSFAVG